MSKRCMWPEYFTGCLQHAKELIVGDRKAFLSMYSTVIAAGRRAFQLERSCRLHCGAGDAQAVREVRNVSAVFFAL